MVSIKMLTVLNIVFVLKLIAYIRSLGVLLLLILHFKDLKIVLDPVLLGFL